MASYALWPARALGWLDARLGRGSYPVLRDRLDPAREYTQLIYGRILRKLVNGRVNWLDAGCGAQILEVRSADEERETAAAARIGVGCDLAMSTLGAHRTLTSRVCCDVRALPFRDRSLQLVSLNNVVEHLEDPMPPFREIARVLDDGARLLIHTPNAASYFIRLVRLGKRILPGRAVRGLIRFLDGRGDEDAFPTYYAANTRAALVRLAQESAMTVERLSLLPCRPLFYFAAPLSVLELVATRAMIRSGFVELGASALVAVFKRVPRRADGGDR